MGDDDGIALKQSVIFEDDLKENFQYFHCLTAVQFDGSDYCSRKAFEGFLTPSKKLQTQNHVIFIISEYGVQAAYELINDELKKMNQFAMNEGVESEQLSSSINGYIFDEHQPV
jgi:hypothetical protein